MIQECKRLLGRWDDILRDAMLSKEPDDEIFDLVVGSGVVGLWETPGSEKIPVKLVPTWLKGRGTRILHPPRSATFSQVKEVFSHQFGFQVDIGIYKDKAKKDSKDKPELMIVDNDEMWQSFLRNYLAAKAEKKTAGGGGGGGPVAMVQANDEEDLDLNDNAYFILRVQPHSEGFRKILEKMEENEDKGKVELKLPSHQQFLLEMNSVGVAFNKKLMEEFYEHFKSQLDKSSEINEESFIVAMHRYVTPNTSHVFVIFIYLTFGF